MAQLAPVSAPAPDALSGVHRPQRGDLALQFVQRLAHPHKRPVFGLVDQHIAVGKEQDAFLAAGFPQPPGNLKSDKGFAGAGGHRQQNTLLPAQDGINHPVDRDHLVVARGFATDLPPVSAQRVSPILWQGQVQRPLQAAPQFVRGWELAQVAFQAR